MPFNVLMTKYKYIGRFSQGKRRLYHKYLILILNICYGV